MILFCLFFLMIRRPPRSTRTDNTFPTRRSSDLCFGLITSPQRLAAIRQERRPDSRYASLEQCTFELRRTAEMFKRHALPVVDSSTISVEEISTIDRKSTRLNSSH